MKIAATLTCTLLMTVCLTNGIERDDKKDAIYARLQAYSSVHELRGQHDQLVRVGKRLADKEAKRKQREIAAESAVLTSQTPPSRVSSPAQTPPMGWNSWYAFGMEKGWPLTDEDNIRETADALVSTGLSSVGYRSYFDIS